MKFGDDMIRFLGHYGIPILFVVMGIVTFIAYGRDKRAAKKHQRRTPEKVLFLLNFCGGSLGGWLGMYAFRHKTRHASFYVVQTVSFLLWVTLWSILWVASIKG